MASNNNANFLFNKIPDSVSIAILLFSIPSLLGGGYWWGNHIASSDAKVEMTKYDLHVKYTMDSLKTHPKYTIIYKDTCMIKTQNKKDNNERKDVYSPKPVESYSLNAADNNGAIAVGEGAHAENVKNNYKNTLPYLSDTTKMMLMQAIDTLQRIYGIKTLCLAQDVNCDENYFKKILALLSGIYEVSHIVASAHEDGIPTNGFGFIVGIKNPDIAITVGKTNPDFKTYPVLFIVHDGDNNKNYTVRAKRRSL